jgi:hypothetical protein
MRTCPPEQDVEYGCEICLKEEEECVCLECPECGAIGDPKCYGDNEGEHGMETTLEQQIAVQEYEIEKAKQDAYYASYDIDENGDEFCNPELCVKEQEKVQKLEGELHLLEAQQTDPYGHLSYAVGSEDDFWCFDYYILPDGSVILHSVINSETGSFIMTGDRFRVLAADAVDEAIGMLDQAYEWCAENGIEIDYKGWGNEDDLIENHRFVTDLTKDLTF